MRKGETEMKLNSQIELTSTKYWVWPSFNFRFNGGGYLYGAQPYKEFAIGPLRFRKYLRGKSK